MWHPCAPLDSRKKTKADCMTGEKDRFPPGSRFIRTEDTAIVSKLQTKGPKKVIPNPLRVIQCLLIPETEQTLMDTAGVLHSFAGQ